MKAIIIFNKMKSILLIKSTLAILLLLCLLKLPYGYYQLVRFVALIGFGFLAYQAKQKDNLTATFIYIALALLFQPFFKIVLGRELWNIVDVVVGVGLLISLFFSSKDNRTRSNI